VETNGALRDVLVLDLSRVLAGPYCTMILGDLGAEVIKIEEPLRGDDTRQWGPPWKGGESAYYLCVNRNKKSVAVNLKHETGREIVRSLAGRADVVVENFLPGKMEEWGLGYEALRRVNPGLVYCSITGYGQDGPSRDRPGYDFIIQAQGGLMGITGPVDGAPSKVGVAIVDLAAGLYAAIAILAALNHRRATGEGQSIDLALLDSQLAWLANVASNHLISGEPARRYGNAHPNIVPYEAFEAQDRWFALAVGNDRQFGRLCGILGRPELAADPRFATNAERVRNREVLVPLLAGLFRERDAEAWLRELERQDIPCAPIQTVEQALADPQAASRGMIVETPHPSAGTVRMIASPIRLSLTPAEVRAHPPLLGEHTSQVLAERLGYDDLRLAALRSEGAIR
jgi:formyl-CoA transferase